MKAQGGFKRQAGKGSAEERLMGQCRRDETRKRKRRRRRGMSVWSALRAACVLDSLKPLVKMPRGHQLLKEGV